MPSSIQVALHWLTSTTTFMWNCRAFNFQSSICSSYPFKGISDDLLPRSSWNADVSTHLILFQRAHEYQSFNTDNKSSRFTHSGPIDASIQPIHIDVARWTMQYLARPRTFTNCPRPESSNFVTCKRILDNHSPRFRSGSGSLYIHCRYPSLLYTQIPDLSLLKSPSYPGHWNRRNSQKLTEYVQSNKIQELIPTARIHSLPVLPYASSKSFHLFRID